LKVLGGVYLVYLAWMLWRHAAKPIELEKAATSSQRSFWLGLATQVSNPKTAVVYASVFVSLLPKEMPLWAMLVLPVLIFCIEAGWYSIVALAHSSTAPAAAYLRWKRWIDRAAGGVMGLLGVKLILRGLKLSHCQREHLQAVIAEVDLHAHVRALTLQVDDDPRAEFGVRDVLPDAESV